MDSSILEIGFKMSVALGVVLLTFGGAVIVAKKFFGKGLPALGKKDKSSERAQVRVETTRMLGQGRSLHVVRFGEKILLVGATAHSINLISETVDLDSEVESFDSMLNSNQEDSKEKSIMSQLGNRLKEISRV